MVSGLSDFLDRVGAEHASTRIPIMAIPDYYTAIVQHLRGQGLSAQELDKEIKTSLRGICPNCISWAHSGLLFMPSLVRQIGREKGSMYGGFSRLLDGRCQRLNCSSVEMLLIWKSEPEIERQISSYLGSFEADTDQRLQELLRPDVLAYTIDAIFAQQLKSARAHLYSGREFADVFVWVSVVPPVWRVETLRKWMFPEGYAKFFDDLLVESRYDDRNIAVMHWTYVSHGEHSRAYLSFLAAREGTGATSPKRGNLVLPLDLLNDEERRQLHLS